MIELAYERGVPLFNGGDPEGCARVYVDAARGLLRLDDAELSRLDRHVLETALAEAAADALAQLF